VDLQLVAYEAFLWLQQKRLRSCNRSACGLATEVLLELQLVATEAFFLQLKCLQRCNRSACGLAIEVLLDLQLVRLAMDFFVSLLLFLFLFFPCKI
jgi:hypothetical protein